MKNTINSIGIVAVISITAGFTLLDSNNFSFVGNEKAIGFLIFGSFLFIAFFVLKKNNSPKV